MQSVVWEVCKCVCRVVVRMVYKGGVQSGGENGVQSVVWEVCQCGMGGVKMRVDYWPDRCERAKSRIGSMPRTKSCGKLWT